MLACEGLKIVQSLWMWELAYQSHFSQSKKKVKKKDIFRPSRDNS